MLAWDRECGGPPLTRAWVRLPATRSLGWVSQPATRNAATEQPDPAAEWWTTSDVAAYLEVRVATVSSYRARGQMPAPDMTVGRTHVWHPETIITWHEGRPRPGVGGRPAPEESPGERRPLEPDYAADLLDHACRIAGLNGHNAHLLRIGSNAVYRLAEPVVVRISRSDAQVEDVQRTVGVARWLESADYPAVRALDVEQPIVVQGHIVTFWQAVSDDGEEYANLREVAEILRRLHALAPPDSLKLPPLSPFESARRRIEENDWLTSEDREFLAAKHSELQEKYGRLEFVLPQGVIHGDASVGNVIHDYGGKPVLIDLDRFAIGPREWDLALTAIYYDSFGWHTRQEYETFVRTYGFDVMTWDGYAVMREVREFLMVTWIIQKAGESPEIAAEAAKRIDALRTGASRKDWRPY